jgi:tetratricopeptide (TPR) repeat protein
MASIVPDYTNDIFISYRQKDNKGDRWVSEFVEALKTELESTFKEEISVYFDINPSDYLLEAYDVDASLKDKLKSLVFIPIISRTYCDPKSFAWGHEFKAFVEQASQDQFGLKVKLANGNVASRVLPVRIHDLDTADIKECESVLGGVLRGVEFIYKEPGVDKPLAPQDNEKKNLNNTTYRIQIIKVTHAIKEIISGLRTPLESGKEIIQQKDPSKEVKIEEKKEVKEKPAKTSKRKLLSGVAIIAVLIIAAIFAYPKLFKRGASDKLKSSDGRISIAIIPFQNMTNDTKWNVWQDGIQFNLITSLSNYSEELKVSQTESINGLIQSKGITNYASITPSVASAISQKLDANIFICGNINQVGKIIRINAQIIDSKTEEPFKSFQLNGTGENILPIIDSLSAMIKDFLIISQLKKEVSPDIQPFTSKSTNSSEAYMYFLYGENARRKSDDSSAAKLYSQAVEIDSNFIFASLMLSAAYYNLGLYDQAKKSCLRIYKKRDQMPLQLKIRVNQQYALYFETPYDEIKYLRQLQELNDQSPTVYYHLGWTYYRLLQYDKAIPEFEKALEIYNKWDIKPYRVANYYFLGDVYHKTGQYKKEKKLYKKAERDYPNDPVLMHMQAVLALSEGKAKDAIDYINKSISIAKENSASEAAIAATLGAIYSEAEMLDNAEKYYHQALSLEPENPVIINTLAYFLIDKDRSINEGMELVEKALKLRPDNYSYLHCKGWGLYKQGKYQEALDILQKSWYLRRQNAVYDQKAFLHLEVAKKAVASQKNN